MSARLHVSLRWTTHLLLLAAWTAIGGAALHFSLTRAIHVPIIGIITGAVAGFCQWASLDEKPAEFRAATSAIEVRRAFLATRWGRRYVDLWRLTLLLFAIISCVTSVNFIVYDPDASLVAGSALFVENLLVMCCGFAWAREAVTLYPAIVLARAT